MRKLSTRSIGKKLKINGKSWSWQNYPLNLSVQILKILIKILKSSNKWRVVKRFVCLLCQKHRYLASSPLTGTNHPTKNDFFNIRRSQWWHLINASRFLTKNIDISPRLLWLRLITLRKMTFFNITRLINRKSNKWASFTRRHKHIFYFRSWYKYYIKFDLDAPRELYAIRENG